jgi:N6-L-threonylcarbamoyladenine synthase
MIAALGAHLVARGVAPSDLNFPVDSTLPVETVRV